MPLTGELLDRLTHRVHIIEANGENRKGAEGSRATFGLDGIRVYSRALPPEDVLSLTAKAGRPAGQRLPRHHDEF